MKKRVFSGICTAALLLGMVAVPQADVKAATKTIYVTKGESVNLSVKKATKKTKWKVSKSKVVKLTKGKKKLTVKGKKKDSIVVSAKIGKKNYKYKIVVETPKISQTVLSLNAGETESVEIFGTKRRVRWQSEDTQIVKVGETSGEITAIKAGETSVFAKVGKKKYSCDVTVSATDSNTGDQASDKTQEPSSEEQNSGSTEQEVTEQAGRDKVEIQVLKIPVGDRTVYGKIYLPAGKGKFPAIILGHGYNGWAEDFVNECKYYAENGYIAYTLDFCGGSGRSRSKGLTSTEMTIFTEKEDMIGVFNYIYNMDETDQSRVYLFGGSQGGLVASLAAEELKDKVRAMPLYFPAYCIPDNWRSNYPDISKVPETFDFWGLKLGRNFVVSMHDFYTFDNIGKYEGNVYILQGDKDAIVPMSYANKAVETYPHAKLKIMEGEAHGFTPAAGKVAMEEVLKFMEENK